jgi:hypothetical protein
MMKFDDSILDHDGRMLKTRADLAQARLGNEVMPSTSRRYRRKLA